MILALLVGIIAIPIFFINFVVILKKIKEEKAIFNNTFICCICLIYIWVLSIMICGN